jgi:hypothetical protein
MATDPPQDPGGQEEPRSIRLTYAYDESGVRIIDRTPVTKPVPPSVEDRPAFTPTARGAEPALPSHAVVAELRSGYDATTYRQIVENAIPNDVEVFEPGVERGARRHPVPLPKGVFTVIVPDDEQAESVVLLAGPGSRSADQALTAGPPGAAVELTRSPLRS